MPMTLMGTYCCGTREIIGIDAADVEKLTDKALKKAFVEAALSNSQFYAGKAFAQYFFSGRRKNIKRIEALIKEDKLGATIVSPTVWFGDKKPKRSVVTMIFTPDKDALSGFKPED